MPGFNSANRRRNSAPHFNLAQGRSRLPGSNAERFGKLNLARPQGYSFVADIHVHHFFLIDPGLDSPGGHPQPDAIPPAGLKINEPGRLVFRCVIMIEAGNAQKRSAPTAHDQTAKRVAYRHRQTAEKI